MKPLEYLSEIEKAKIIAFNTDAVLANAVRKVLLETIYNNGVLRAGGSPDPLRNGALGLAFLTLGGKALVSNEELGADLRGLAQGVNLLEQGLAQLAKIKKDQPDEVSSGINEAV